MVSSAGCEDNVMCMVAHGGIDTLRGLVQSPRGYMEALDGFRSGFLLYNLAFRV